MTNQSPWFLAFTVLSVMIIGFGIWLFWEWDIPYEYAFSFDAHESVRMVNGEMVVWYGLSNTSYLPISLLFDDYEEATGSTLSEDYVLQPDEYTYIVL